SWSRVRSSSSRRNRTRRRARTSISSAPARRTAKGAAVVDGEGFIGKVSALHSMRDTRTGESGVPLLLLGWRFLPVQYERCPRPGNELHTRTPHFPEQLASPRRVANSRWRRGEGAGGASPGPAPARRGGGPGAVPGGRH